MTTLLIIVGMFAAHCLISYVHAGRTWDRAYELGWQHGRSELEREQEERAEQAILVVHGGAIASRRGRAVN